MIEKGKKVNSNFQYSSDKNTFLTISEIKKVNKIIENDTLQ